MKPSPATVIASLALFVAVGGPAEAAKLINGSQIKKGTISSKQIKDRGLGVRDLSTSARKSLTRTPARSVGTAQLLEGAVGAAQIRPGSVTAAALSPDSVAGSNIIDKQVGNADLADSAVTAGKLATGSVRKSEIAAAAVGTSELSNGAVTGDKLADGAVATGKLAPDAVTGAQILDGSVGAADFADANGTVSLTLGSVAANTCAFASIAVASPRGTLEDDVIVATPPSSWPPALTLLAKPAGPQSISLTVCNLATPPAMVSSVPVRILAITT